MTRVRVATMLALGAVLSGPALVAGQDGALESVDGFNGHPWGASRTEIEASSGRPERADVLDNGVTVLAFRDSLLDREAVTLYALVDGIGLVKGQHVARIDVDEGDCDEQYRAFRDHVTLLYPLLQPVENFEIPLEGDFCAAIEERTAVWATQWKDPSTGSVITVIVEEGSDLVKLIYESRAFLDWLGAPVAAEDDPD